MGSLYISNKLIRQINSWLILIWLVAVRTDLPRHYEFIHIMSIPMCTLLFCVVCYAGAMRRLGWRVLDFCNNAQRLLNDIHHIHINQQQCLKLLPPYLQQQLQNTSTKKQQQQQQQQQRKSPRKTYMCAYPISEPLHEQSLTKGLPNSSGPSSIHI